MDVSVLGVATWTRECPLREADCVFLFTLRTPLRCRNPFVKDNRLRESLQPCLDPAKTRMLDLLSEQAFLPSCDLLVLHADAAVSLQLADYLVCLVFFSVRELLVLSLDQLDCLVPVVRSYGSSEHLLLKSLKPIAFFNSHIKLLTLACCYVRLDPKVKPYFLSILLFFLEIFFVDEARYLQIISIRLLDEIRVRQFIHVLQLSTSPDKELSGNTGDADLVERLEHIRVAILLEWNAVQF